MLKLTEKYLQRVMRENRLIQSRQTLAKLAVIFEARHDKESLEKTRKPYRMNHYHLEMIKELAKESGKNNTQVLRLIIDEWFEYKRNEALHTN